MKLNKYLINVNFRLTSDKNLVMKEENKEMRR